MNKAQEVLSLLEDVKSEKAQINKQIEELKKHIHDAEVKLTSGNFLTKDQHREIYKHMDDLHKKIEDLKKRKAALK